MGFSAYKPGPPLVIPDQSGQIGDTVPTRGAMDTDICNILCCPLFDDTDLTGNHVFDDGTPTFANIDSNHGCYDGGTALVASTSAGTGLRMIASSQPHQIPHTEPVTFGFLIYMRTISGTPQLMCSGPGANNSNYGIQRQASAGWRHQGSGVTTMGDHRSKTPAGRFYHVCLAIEAGRSSSPAGAFYLNGQEAWTGTIGNAQAVSSTDDFAFTGDADETNSSWTGFMVNAFITDTLLDAATIQNLSDEAFGHASPLMI